ncbi:MAG: tetratricopeptide repeat protein [Sedimentisphaerales bacterium]|nr:tetratricopeptide repeat protein [Sedimentisphaerales bacterium]
MFVLSAVSSAITFVVQQRSLVVASLERWPVHIRAVNAIGCYWDYVAKMLYPKGLAIQYPFPEKLTFNSAALAVMGVAVLLVLWGRGRRWLVVGLLWYLGTLVPVIGLVQVGWQMMADRYTYLPSIGIFIIIAWGAEEIFTKKRYPKWMLASVAAAALIAIVLITKIQTGYWRNTDTLYKHTLAATKNNYIILNSYGQYLCQQGKYKEGIPYFWEALSIKPNYIPASDNICVAFLGQNKLDEAISCFTEFLQKEKHWPELYRTHFNLGLAYEQKGNFAEAESNYRKALELNPNCYAAREALSAVQARQDKSP